MAQVTVLGPGRLVVIDEEGKEMGKGWEVKELKLEITGPDEDVTDNRPSDKIVGTLSFK